MQKCTPFWHKMLKIASASWGGRPRPPPPPRCRPQPPPPPPPPPSPPSREGLLAFGNCSSAPSALALSPNFSRSVPPKLHTDFRLCVQREFLDYKIRSGHVITNSAYVRNSFRSVRVHRIQCKR